MTASIANGFGHILYEPTSTTCHVAPYAFHPEYGTANPRGNTWSAHTYNVAYSDEIGHFENCIKIDANFNCANPAQHDAGGLDPDDDNNFCVPGSDSLLVKINGCFSGDGDWDGPSYQNDWPGTDPNARATARMHPSPILFTSPKTTQGTTNYSTIAFEADLPRIEASDSQDNPPFCDTTTGANCVNPPNGRAVLPVLLDHERQRRLRLAGRRRLHPRNHERLRRKLDRRVRPAAQDRVPTSRVSRPWCGSTTSTAATCRTRAGRDQRQLGLGGIPLSRT